MFDSIRKDPEFAAIREESLRRQKEFVARRGTAGSAEQRKEEFLAKRAP